MNKNCKTCNSEFRTKFSKKVCCSLRCQNIRELKLANISRKKKKLKHSESGVCVTPQKAECGCLYHTAQYGHTFDKVACIQPEKPSDLLEVWESMWPFNQDTILINSVKKLLQAQATKSYAEGYYEGAKDQAREDQKMLDYYKSNLTPKTHE